METQERPRPAPKRQSLTSGFTLVELVVVGVVLSLMSGAVFALAQTTGLVWSGTDARLASFTQAQKAVNRLSEDLRQACRSTVVCTAGQVTFKRAPCQAADPVMTYTWASNNLMRQVGGDPPSTVTDGLTALTIPRCDVTNGLVMLDLTARARAASGGSSSPQRVVSQVWIEAP